MGTCFVCYMARIMKIIMQLSALLQETKASLAFKVITVLQHKGMKVFLMLRRNIKNAELL